MITRYCEWQCPGAERTTMPRPDFDIGRHTDIVVRLTEAAIGSGT